MTPSEEFLRHAAECESMARFSRDLESKIAWHGMAERWSRCAELAKNYNIPIHHNGKPKTHRRSPPAWAHDGAHAS